MSRSSRLGNQDGFTIVEVLVAATILLVGILGVATIVNAANSTTTSNKAREQGLALGRELVESARSVRYQALRPATVVATLQAMPGFASNGGSGWTIKRRGITYTVSVGVCSVDDLGDGKGAHVAGTFCQRSSVQANGAKCAQLIGNPPRINGVGGAADADSGDCGLDTDLDGQVDNLVQSTATPCDAGTSVAAGTCDSQPDDFKRLVTLITWDHGSGSRYVLQQATVPFPGLAAYGSITSIVPNTGNQTANGYTIGTGDGAGSNPSTVTFTGTSDQAANQVNWLKGGVDQGPTNWSGTTGTWTWNLHAVSPPTALGPAQDEVLDGTYLIGARVQDSGGIHGNELDIAVTLDRRAPFPPSGFDLTGAGSGSVTGTWNAAQDNDIVGYELHRVNGGSDQVACTTATLSCTDTNPPTGATVTYYVVAKDAAGHIGQQSLPKTSTQGSGNTAPTVPTGLTAGTPTGNGNNTSVTLSWSASTDAQTGVQKYAIYRSDKTLPIGYSNGTATTYTDQIGNNNTFQYRVSAIDTQGMESGKSTAISVSS